MTPLLQLASLAAIAAALSCFAVALGAGVALLLVMVGVLP